MKIFFTVILSILTLAAFPQTGNFGVGISTPLEKLDVNGALRIGNTVNTNDGTIRFNGTDFEGRKAGVWVSLTSGGSSQWTTSGNNIFNTNTGNVGIDTAAAPFKLTIGGDGGIMATGIFGSGAPLTASGDNSRLIWYPRKGAFRAGNVDGGDEWDDINIGDYSFAGGYNTQASDEGAVAIGYQAKATARAGVAMGFFPLAGGEGSVALGGFAEATGSFSTAIGLFSCACGENSTSIGQAVTSSGDNSMAAGTYANTNFKDGAFALGDHSTVDDLLSSADNEFSSRFDGGYRWFSDAATTDANALFLKGGNVGIGVPAPTNKLEVAGTLKTANFQMTAGSGTAGMVLTSDINGNASWSAPAANAENDPKVGILTTNKVPHWNGTALANGIITDNGAKLSVGGNVEIPAGNTFSYSSAKAKFYSVSSYAFNTEGLYHRANTTLLGAVWIADGTAGAPGYLYAGVNLPDGAVVMGVDAYVADFDATAGVDIDYVQLVRNFGPNGLSSTVAQTNGTNGFAGIVKLTTNLAMPIDNSIYSYHLIISTRQNAPNLLIYQVTIRYTVTAVD